MQEEPSPLTQLLLIFFIGLSGCGDTDRFVVGGKPFAIGSIIVGVAVLLILLAIGAMGVYLLVSGLREKKKP